MLMTRPSSSGGVMSWRRLRVLMLKNMPVPEAAAHSATLSWYQGQTPRAATSRPERIRAPRIAWLNEKRRRMRPARKPNTVTPRLPAAKRMPTWKSLARRWCLEKNTS